jgi:hypothetical protein
MCIHPDCKVIPTYNIQGHTKPLYCSAHKLEGMVNVKHKTCIYPDCKVIANYNIQEQTKALYCSAHKLKGMVDVKHKTCIYPDCKVRPNYNVQGKSKALYCSAHKLEGMIDVINKTCIYPDCKVRPNYNVQGQSKALYCSAHKLEGMIDVKHKTCIYPDCKVRPTYNVAGQKEALYCFSHKLEGMVDIKNKTCKNDWCSTQVSKKYDGYCLFCYMNMFPDKPVSRNYKTKEYSVVEYVKNNFSNFDWITDKKVNGGCSKRRPDLLLDLGYQVLIIEIDEKQHDTYGCSCENKRIMELSQDLGHRPIIFIRFNPDSYITNNKNITSCWGINNQGICVVKKSKKDEWDERLTCLKKSIIYWTDPSNITNKSIETIPLFYDTTIDV